MSKQLAAQVPAEPVVLGKMGSSYGIRGWLRVFSSTEDAESIFDYQPWFIQKAGQWQQVQLESWKHHNQDLIIKLKGVDDRDAANLLTNCEIVVDSSQLPALEEGDYYWKDLMGCQVVTAEGYDLGKVIDMQMCIRDRGSWFLNHRINGNKWRYGDWLVFIGIVSLFPEMFRAITDYGVTGRAVKKGLLNIQSWSPRDFTHDRHRTVDDRPYGGGPGMLMMVQPLRDAIHAAKAAAGEGAKVIYLSPQGRKLDQAGVSELATNQKLILVCGRYEGVDERVIQTEIDEEWSIGDYVLSGGELPAMTLIDSVARFIPGVLGHEASAIEDSFADGLLDCPHYTRPEVLEGMEVPPVLLSGNHAEIRRWRLKQSLGRTWLRRPELLENLALTEEQARLLAEFKTEHAQQQHKHDGMA